MLTRIVHNSTKLYTFIDQLNLNLSKPQRQHILNLADALRVCEDEKTLAALQRKRKFAMRTLFLQVNSNFCGIAAIELFILYVLPILKAH